jgi:REP element-mobilizing transposase RayT
MISDRPFALHITWTCYGTWLPGDPRGHVSNVLLPERGFCPKENVPGTPYSRGDKFTHQRARALQKEPTVYLTAEQALVVAVSLNQAAQARSWRILRGAIMANHIHVVLMDCPNDGPAVRRILKGTSQAVLNDYVGHNQTWWTAGGSDRYKNDWPAIEAAVQYVADQPNMLAAIIDGRAAGFIPAVQTARPAMTDARARVLHLLHRYCILGYELTPLEVHKLLYFLQVSGERLQLRFTKETHGPYADNLRHVLLKFEGHFTLGFGDGCNAPTTPLCLLPDALQEAEQFLRGQQKGGSEAEQRLERVTQLIEGFESPYGLELLASVHWIATHCEEQATDPDSAVRAILSWNDRKRRTMKPEHIRLAWRRLHEKDWISGG